MPYIYAIAEHVYEDGLPPEPGKFKRATLKYHPVSKEVAEAHEEGRWKLQSHEGTDMSDWNTCLSSYRELYEGEGKAKKIGKSLPDVTGQLLEVGDFVMGTRGTGVNLHIYEVVNFTPKKIRVRTAGSWGEGSTKNSEDIVKVDKARFF